MIERSVLDEFGLRRMYASQGSSSEAWNHLKFVKDFEMQILKMDENDLELQLVNCHTIILLTLKRILTRIPIMAIDKVDVKENDSPVMDEMLAHRLAMVPIKVDSNLFEPLGSDKNLTSKNSIAFKLCTKSKKSDAKNDNIRNIFSRDLEWVPVGDQSFLNGNIPRPVNEDILLVKLAPSQEIDLTAYCVIGTGIEHAKFSPVAPVNYRHFPEITLNKQITGDSACKLQKLFPQGVIEVVQKDGVNVAQVSNPLLYKQRIDIFRHPEFKDSVTVSLLATKFIFSFDGSGVMPAKKIFTEGIKVFLNDLEHLTRAVDDLLLVT